MAKARAASREIAKVAKAAEAVFGLGAGELYSPSSTRRLSEPRFAAYLIARRRGHAFAAIGATFGRSFVSAIYGTRRAAEMAELYPDYAEKIDEIERRMSE